LSKNMSDDDLAICPDCGAEVYLHANRCPHCGNTITPVLSRTRGGRGLLFAVIAVITLAALLAVALLR
jgi:predicted amidophosphoribosyltransferase